MYCWEMPHTPTPPFFGLLSSVQSYVTLSLVEAKMSPHELFIRDHPAPATGPPPTPDPPLF